MGFKDFLRAIGLALPEPDGPPSNWSPGASSAIASFKLPPDVWQRIVAQHPQVRERRLEVEDVARDFLELLTVAPDRELVVPSRLVRDTLVEFARHPDWQTLCRQAYGATPTLVPFENPDGSKLPDKRLATTWRLACQQQGIDPDQPERLPRLFEADERCGIDNPWRHKFTDAAQIMLRQIEQDRLSMGDATEYKTPNWPSR